VADLPSRQICLSGGFASLADLLLCQVFQFINFAIAFEKALRLLILTKD